MARRFTRRRFLKFTLGSTATVGLSTLGGAGYAILVEPSWLELERVNMLLPNLPANLDGFTIAQLSDLHCGPTATQNNIARAVDVTSRQDADLIVLTGDFVYRSAGYSAAYAQELASLQARYGVYAVLDNHDI